MSYLSSLMVLGICVLSAGCLSFGEAGADRGGGRGLEVEEAVANPPDDDPDGPPCVEDADCPASDNPCNGPQVCIQGSCFPGNGPDLFDGKMCTNDSCDLKTGIVTHTPVNVDDGNPCTKDACTEGVGITHEPISSPDCG